MPAIAGGRPHRALGHSVQYLYRGAQHAGADVDAEGAVDLALPHVVVVGQGGLQLLLELGHLLGGPAVGHGQVVLFVAAAGFDHQVDELILNLSAPSDLGDGLELPVGGEGDEGLDLEHGARHGGDLADATALEQVLQGVHREEGKGALDEIGHPPVGQLPPGGAGAQVLGKLKQGHAHTQGPAHRVVDLDFQIAALLGQQPGHIIGARQAAGEHDGDDPVVPLRGDAVEGAGDVLPGGERGLGQLAGAEPGVDVGGVDVHSVPVFPIGAADVQGHHMDVVFLRQLGGEIGAGIGQQRDFAGSHTSITSPSLDRGKPLSYNSHITSLCNYRAWRGECQPPGKEKT